MKLEDLLDPEKLPEELQWVAEHYRLQPNDPVFVLIAWHWQTIQGAESKLAGISMELQAALTAKGRVITDSAQAIANVGVQLGKVQAALEAKPVALAQQLENQLSAPVTAAVRTLAAAEKAMLESVKIVERTQQRHLLAAFVVGVGFGSSLVAWALL